MDSKTALAEFGSLTVIALMLCVGRVDALPYATLSEVGAMLLKRLIS